VAPFADIRPINARLGGMALTTAPTSVGGKRRG
jgi:hypothetical protein